MKNSEQSTGTKFPNRANWSTGTIFDAERLENSGTSEGVKKAWEKRHVPGVGAWNTYGGGTSSPDKNSYDYTHPETKKKYSIDPVANKYGRHLGYRAGVFPSAQHGHAQINSDGSEAYNGTGPLHRSPQAAASAANEHAKKVHEASAGKTSNRSGDGLVNSGTSEGAKKGAETKREGGLNAQEKKAVSLYTGAHAHEFQHHARGQKVSKEFQEHAKHLDSAIEKSTLKQPKIIHTAVTERPPGEMKPGMIVQHSGYTSGTSRSLGDGMSGRWMQTKAVQVHIHAPAGQKVLDTTPHSAYSEEQEHIFPRNQRFMVTKNHVDPDSQKTHIHMIPL